ncbi:MAG: hypothetical protein ABI388_04285 [Bacteroidia bacterium]
MKNSKIIFAAIIISFATALQAQDLGMQTPPAKVKEYGVGLSNLNSFSLQYRWGNEKTLFRINATVGGSTGFGKGSNNTTETQDTNYVNNNASTTKKNSPINFNTSLSFSVLKIKYVTEKFGLMCGGVAGISYSTTNTQTNQTGTNTYYNGYNNASNGSFPYSETIKGHSQNIQPFVGVVLGAVYKISPSFLVYLEIAPNIYYAHTNTTSTTASTSQQPNHFLINGTTKNATNTIGIASLSNSGAMLTFVYRITK